MAKKWHPDSSKEKDAKEKFHEIQAAYDVRSVSLFLKSKLITIFRFYQTTKNAKLTIDMAPLQHRRALILISRMALAGSVDSKASALVLVTALVIFLSLFLEVHLAAVAVHSVAVRGLLGGTIWRLELIFHSWKLATVSFAKLASHQWLIARLVLGLV